MNTDQSFKAQKRDDLKLIYKIKLDNQENYCKKRVITKILKLDENNQYSFAMTKPMPTGCIKEKEPPSQLDFDILLETVHLDDSTRHLFIVDIFFDEKNSAKKELLYNEIFPPSLEKQKTLDTYERSAYQLLELFDKNEDKQKSCRCTAKHHVTLFPKNFIPLCLEDQRFLIKSWTVTKVYTHFTFEQ